MPDRPFNILRGFPVISVFEAEDLRPQNVNTLPDVAVAFTANIPALSFFWYDASSFAVDDGLNVIKPDDVPLANPGRWLHIPTAASETLRFNLNGLFSAATPPFFIDPPHLVPFPKTIQSVQMIRRRTGLGGATSVQLNKNNVPILAAPLTIAAGADYAQASTSVFNPPGANNLIAGDILEVVVLSVETFNAGPPQGPETLGVDVLFLSSSPSPKDSLPMTTFPQVFNNIGARIPLTWSEAGPSGLATVDGLQANFAGIAGGETITLGRDGGAPVAINFLAGDNSRAAIIARINATFAAYAAPSPDSGGIRLQADQISVTAISGTDFDKIGIPLIAKDKTQLTRSYVLLEAAAQDADRTDKISNAVAIPAGANEVALWTSYLLEPASQRECNPVIAACWSNGVEGEAPFTSLQSVVSESLLFPATPGGLTDPNSGRAIEVGNAVLVMVGAYPDITFRKMVRLAIPPGATKFHLLALQTYQSNAGTYPYKAPKLEASVTFGAR